MEHILKDFNLPPVGQVCFVVKDLKSGMEKYAKLFNIKSWYEGINREKRFYDKEGRELPVKMELCLGYAGRTSIELIATLDGDKSTYSDFYEKQGEGIHHLGIYLAGIEAKVAAFKKAGIEPVMRGKMVSRSGMVKYDFAYMDTQKEYGIVIELIDIKMLGVNIIMSPFWLMTGTLIGDAKKTLANV